MEKDKIELKCVMATAEVADYLTALAKGFRAGRIVVEKDGEHLVLSPDAMVKAEVEVEARLKKDKAKFSLELTWRLAQEAEDEPASLRISTDLPKAADKKPEEQKIENKKPEAKPSATPPPAAAKPGVTPPAPAALAKPAAPATPPAKPKA